MSSIRFGALAGAIGIALAGAAGAEELRLAHWVPPQHPLQPTGLVPWGESITAASEGRLTITIFPAQQLGAAADHYDMARDGIADITYVNPGYQAGRFPIIAHGEIPFYFTNAKSGSRALDAWYRAYAEEEMGDVKFCMAFAHSPGTFHAKDKLVLPEDVQRQEHPAGAGDHRAVRQHAGRRERLGAGARSARDAGAGRCGRDHLPVELALHLRHRRHHEAPSRHPALRHDLRPGHEQGALREPVGGGSPGDRRPLHQRVGGEDGERLGRLGGPGPAQDDRDPAHEVYEPTAADVQAWRDAAAPLLDAWKADVAAKGYDADAIHEALVKSLKDNGALYQ